MPSKLSAIARTEMVKNARMRVAYRGVTNSRAVKLLGPVYRLSSGSVAGLSDPATRE